MGRVQLVGVGMRILDRDGKNCDWGCKQPTSRQEPPEEGMKKRENQKAFSDCTGTVLRRGSF